MSRKGKVRYEAKCRLAQACINKRMEVCEAARIAQIDHSAVRRWIKQYEAEGAEGLLPHAKVMAAFLAALR